MSDLTEHPGNVGDDLFALSAVAEIERLRKQLSRLTPTPEEREAMDFYASNAYNSNRSRILRAYLDRVTDERTEP